MENTTQAWALGPSPATLNQSPTYPAQRTSIDGSRPEEPQYQYNPPMTYYPNQTLPGYRRPSKPTTPPASAPPVITSPTYYPRADYQPTSAPPQPQYSYYPGYTYDYNEYPRQPSGSSIERTPDFSPRYYDPRQYRPQQYYPQQYNQWPQPAQGYYPPPQPVSPPKPEKVSRKRTAEQVSTDTPNDVKEPKEKGKKKKAKKEEIEEDETSPRPPHKSLLNPPRQAQSAWQLFFADELIRAKSSLAPETSAKLNVAQVAKDAGTAYQALDGERKAYYAAMVVESKAQYAKDLIAWQATLTPEDIRQENAFRAQQRKEGKSRKGNLKDPNAPKKPLSAYFLFLKTIREDSDLRAMVWGAETETTKQSVMAAEKWRGLTDVEKKPYLQRAEKDKADYETAKRLYEDDNAARARGEHVPERALPDPNVPNVELPESMKLHSPTATASGKLHSPIALGSGFDPQEEWSDLHHLMEQHGEEKPEFFLAE